MGDKVKLRGIMEQGYGISPKLVMRDKNLSIEAKAIYAYISSFAGNGESAFPKIETACKDLQISKKRFLNHRKNLIDYGYITIEKNRSKGKFDNNVYIINHTVVSNRQHGESSTRQNDTTNNNKDLNNNNSINSSSSNAHEFYEQNFGMMTPFIAESISYWINDLQEELVIESMKIALSAGKKFNYAEGVMKDWLKNNVKTIDDAKAKEVEFEKNKKVGEQHGLHGRGNSYAGNTPKGTSYEQAVREAERARQSFGR